MGHIGPVSLQVGEFFDSDLLRIYYAWTNAKKNQHSAMITLFELLVDLYYPLFRLGDIRGTRSYRFKSV